MTIVIARKFGDRILIASDTMITPKSGKRSPTIPGRLKAIIIDWKLSIAYAGLSEPAITAIRNVKLRRNSGECLSDTLEYLRECSRGGDVDFIVASHDDGPRLAKISNAIGYFDLAETAIGDTDLVKIVLGREDNVRARRQDFRSSGEQRFQKAFTDLFSESGTQLTGSVGGLPIFLLASPFGHTYQAGAFVSAWDRVSLGTPVSGQQIADRRSGMTEWRFQIIDSKFRGLGIIGIGVPMAGVGWVHSPLQADDAFKVTLSEIGEDAEVALSRLLISEIETRGSQIGGGICVDNTPQHVSEIKIEQLKEIVEYAERSKNPTKIQLHREGFWITCGDERRHSGGLVHYLRMDDPVLIVKAAIDDMNDDISEALNGPHHPL